MALGSIGRLFIEIGVETSGLSQGFNDARSQISGFGGTLQRHGKAIGAAMTGIGVVSMGIAVTSVDAFKTMNTAMAGVKKTSGMTSEEIAIMQKEFIALSKEMPISAAELANVGAVAGQLGISGKDNIVSFTKTVSMMSSAFNMSAEDAATAMAKMATIYDIPISEVGRLGSSVNVLGNTTAATESEIMNFSMSLGAASKELGFSSTESLAMGATLISMGMDASDSGTRLNSAFVSLGGKVEEASSLLGMTEQEFSKAFGENPMAMLQALMGKIGDIEDPLARNTAAADLFGTVGAKAVTALSSNATELNVNLKNAQSGFEENTSLTQEYANATDTLASKLEIAKNKTEASAIALGQAMAPATIAVADATSGLAGMISTLPEPLQTMAGMAIMAAAGIGSIGGPLMMMIGSAPAFMASVGTMTTSVWGFTAALLANPMTWVVIAIVAALAILYLAWMGNWGGIQEKTQAVWDWLVGFFSGLISGISSTVTNVISWLASFGDKLLFLLGPIGAIIYAFKNWEQIKSIVSGIISSVISYITGMAGNFYSAGSGLISSLISGVQSQIARAIAIVQEGLAKIRRLLPGSDAKEGPLSDITASGQALMTTFASGMQDKGSAITDAFAQNSQLQTNGVSTQNGNNAGGGSFTLNIQNMNLSKDYNADNMLDDIRNRRMREGMRF